jgi:lysophospholipase L1-like esterase
MMRYSSRALVTVVLLVAIVATPIAAHAAERYYLSLGDSLAAGYQPIDPTDSLHQSYADQLVTALQAKHPHLSLTLKKLGCYGETTATMITGGLCPYPYGSQLAEAVVFLRLHRGAVALVTIDIGANDEDCPITVPLDWRCIGHGLRAIKRDLPTILTTLREAAGPEVPIVGMNYYAPFLALWLQGESGRVDAIANLPAFLLFNETLEQIYKTHGLPVADVESAFSTTDFSTTVLTPDLGPIPLNVARICQWTWMCAPPPLGPDIHANAEGYGVIAGAFVKVLP